MTVLKRDSGSAERAARFGATRAHAPPSLAIDPLVAEVERLRERLAARDREFAAQADDAEASRTAALARGRNEGRAEAASGEQDRLAALADGIERALSSLSDRIAGERDLAIDIAEAALTAMVGDAIPYRALVAATAARHAAALSHGAIVRLLVSAQDFPDDAALATLPGFDRVVEVIADPALSAGACRFELTLGALDASIPTQVAALTRIMAGARAA